ncbi:MAG: outer membrane protein assembly factor BamB family protein [Planctomycetota bacterium]|jgi:outer membrane protein assembly factor BamB
MIHGKRDKSVGVAAGLAILATVVGVMACPARAGERPGTGRAAARGDKDARRAKEDPKPQQASPGGMFDTPERTGVYFATGVKVPPEVKWKLKGAVSTAPVIRDGRVYVGGWGVYCLKLATGEEIWHSKQRSYVKDLTVANGVVYAPVSEDKSRRGPDGSPLTPGKYKHQSDAYLVALDAFSGRELWRISPFLTQRGPVAAGGVLYFGRQAKEHYCLFCVDARTRRTLWEKPLFYYHCRRVVRTRNRVYATVNGCMAALDTYHGKKIWSFRRPACPSGFSPVVNRRIFVAFHNDRLSPPSWLEAIDARTGRTLWKFRPKESITMDPVAWDENVFFGDRAAQNPEETNAGNFYVLDAATGELKWQFHSPEGWFVQSPAVADAVVYLQGCDGVLRAFDVSDGTLLWQFQLPALKRSWAVATYNIGAPAVADGLVLVVAGDQRLYALGSAETEPSPGDAPQEDQSEAEPPTLEDGQAE